MTDRSWKNSAEIALRRLEKHPCITLTALFLILIELRWLLIYRSSLLPSIMADELRYLNIASSILSEGRILFRGQPIAYAYILYPLLIAPLNLLPEGVNMYRAVELFNIVCLSLAVFPAYGLALRLTRSRGSALFAAFSLAFLPDTVMARHVMVECVALPMVLIALFLIVRMLEKPERFGRWIASGILCFLLYALKPVYVMLGIASILIIGLRALKAKDTIRIRGVALFAVTMAALWLLLQIVLRFALGYDGAQQTLFATQTAGFSIAHIVQTLDGLGKYAFYHVLAFGILPVAIAITLIRRLDAVRAQITAILVTTIFFTMLCVVYMFYVDELMNQNGIPLRVHIRYAAMYYPVFLMLLLCPEARDLKPRKAGVALFAFILAGLGVYSASDFQWSGMYYSVDSMMMSALILSNGFWVGEKMWLPIYCGALIPLSAVALKTGFSKNLRNGLIALLLAAMAVNQCAAFTMDRYGLDGNADASARQLDEITGGDAFLVCQDGDEMSLLCVAADVHTRCEANVFKLSDIIRNMNADGSLSGVLPSDYENYVFSKATYRYGTPRYIALDAAVQRCLVVERDVPVTYTDGNALAILTVNGQTPWLHSALSGLKDSRVGADSFFVLYNADLLSKGTVTLSVRAASAAGGDTLYLRADGGEAYYANLTTEYAWYSFPFTVTGAGAPLTVRFSSDNGRAYVDNYTIQ
jgi:hypothetical protein